MPNIETTQVDSLKGVTFRIHGWTPYKYLDARDERHPEFIEGIRIRFTDVFMDELLLCYWRIQDILHCKADLFPVGEYLTIDNARLIFRTGPGEWNFSEMGKWIDELRSRWDKVKQATRGGVVIIGPAASGKTTILEILRAIGLSDWAVGEEQESHLACVAREGVEIGSASFDDEERRYNSLLRFVEEKVRERLRNNIIHSILVRNGVNPVAIGGIVQVVVSVAAYAGMREIPQEWIWALKMAPFTPQYYLLPLVPLDERFKRAARDGGPEVARREGAFMVDGALRCFYDELIQVHVLKGVVYIDADTPGGILHQLQSLIFSMPGNIDVRQIIYELRKFLPSVDPAIVISHIEPKVLVSFMSELNPEKFDGIILILEEALRKLEGKLSLLQSTLPNPDVQELFNIIRNGLYNPFLEYLINRVSTMRSLLLLLMQSRIKV